MQPSSAPHSDGEPEDHRHTKPKLNQPFFSFTNHNQNHTIHPYFNHSLKMFQPSINSFPKKRTNPLLGSKNPKFPFLSLFFSFLSPYTGYNIFFLRKSPLLKTTGPFLYSSPTRTTYCSTKSSLK